MIQGKSTAFRQIGQTIRPSLRYNFGGKLCWAPLQEYLKAKEAVKEKSIVYYCRWVANYYSHIELGSTLDAAQKRDFLLHMEKSHQDWQVKQAERAIQLYAFYLASSAPLSSPSVGKEGEKKDKAELDQAWSTIETKMREILRLKQRSYSTEKTYIGWLRAFRGQFGDKTPEGDPKETAGSDAPSEVQAVFRQQGAL